MPCLFYLALALIFLVLMQAKDHVARAAADQERRTMAEAWAVTFAILGVWCLVVAATDAWNRAFTETVPMERRVDDQGREVWRVR